MVDTVKKTATMRYAWCVFFLFFFSFFLGMKNRGSIGGPWTRSKEVVHGPSSKRWSMDLGSRFCPVPFRVPFRVPFKISDYELPVILYGSPFTQGKQSTSGTSTFFFLRIRVSRFKTDWFIYITLSFDTLVTVHLRGRKTT